jgi:hypothetical protein
MRNHAVPIGNVADVGGCKKKTWIGRSPKPRRDTSQDGGTFSERNAAKIY